MIDGSCEVPREDLDDGFNPCRKQVVENGGLEAYAHMYDVMNERYDREEDTSRLNSVKRDKITSTTPVLLAGNNTQIYANSKIGEGLVHMLSSSAFNNPGNHDELSIPSAKAVADHVAAAFADHIADSVADNDLLPTNALMIDYVGAHSMETPPDKFSFAVSPVPTGTWDGAMTINVVPAFATTIGRVTYVVARVYGSKRFNYTGSAASVNLFLGLKPVEEYTNALNSSTNIPLTLSVSGRSYTQGTYGFTPNGSTANLSLNNQVVSSVFNLGDLNISNNLKCVFGEGTNTPAVTVTVNSMALMWYSPM